MLEWVAFSFSRGSSQPRDWTQVSRVAGGFSLAEPLVCFILFFLNLYRSHCVLDASYSKPFTNINSFLSHNYACTIHLQIIESWHWEIPYHMSLLIYRKSFWKMRKYIAILKQLAGKIDWNIYLNAHLYLPAGSDIPDIEMYILKFKWFESVYKTLEVLKTHRDLTGPLAAKQRQLVGNRWWSDAPWHSFLLAFWGACFPPLYLAACSTCRPGEWPQSYLLLINSAVRCPRISNPSLLEPWELRKGFSMIVSRIVSWSFQGFQGVQCSVL